MVPNSPRCAFDRDDGDNTLQRAVGEALALHSTVQDLGDPASRAAVDLILIELGRLLGRRLELDV